MNAPKSIARNALWNITGQAAPIVIALICVPWLIKLLGIERFGFLSLAWALIGYAGLFDLGLGRALTRVVAGHLAAGRTDQARAAGRTGTLILTAIGAVVGLGLIAGATPLIEKVLRMPAALRPEAMTALRLLALSMPLVLLTTALRGVLEAAQEFRRLNLIRIVMGVLTYAGPLAAAVNWPKLQAVVLMVVAMRVLGAWMHLTACKRTLGSMLALEVPERVVVAGLFAVGGWIGISNVVSPLLTYLDRFVIAQSLNIAQVAYYATPYDLITRTLVVPYAVMAVTFPALAARRIQQMDLSAIYATSVRLLWVLMWPLCFTAVVLAHPLLEMWLGRSFAQHSAPVLQVLAVGVFINALAQAPANLIQAAGNPKWMALLHVAELPVFIVALWFVVQRHGIVGAAMAWSTRVALDAAALYLMVGKRLVVTRMPLRWWLGATAFCAATAALGLFAREGLPLLSAWLLGLIGFAIFAWFVLLLEEDRKWLGVRIALRLKPVR